MGVEIWQVVGAGKGGSSGIINGQGSRAVVINAATTLPLPSLPQIHRPVGALFLAYNPHTVFLCWF